MKLCITYCKVYGVYNLQSPTESPRFKALLRMTKTNGKRHTDIKSFSHELDPRGLRSHEFLRPHNFGGFNGLEVFSILHSCVTAGSPSSFFPPYISVFVIIVVFIKLRKQSL